MFQEFNELRLLNTQEENIFQKTACLPSPSCSFQVKALYRSAIRCYKEGAGLRHQHASASCNAFTKAQWWNEANVSPPQGVREHKLQSWPYNIDLDD